MTLTGKETCMKTVLVSFNVVDMFPSMDNKMGIESVKNILLTRYDKYHLQNA